MLRPNDPTAQSRSLYLTGGVSIAIAVLAVFVFGVVPAALLAVAGVGNLWAATVVGRGRPIPTPARAMILIGGIGFAALLVVLGIMTMTR